MSVVTEKSIRKIISSKIEKSHKVNEVGFKKRLQFNLGRTDVIECDLSNLKNTKFAVKFAKHFIFNPTITSRDENGVSTEITKRNLISFLTGLGVSDTLDKKYEQQVENLVKQNPSLIDKWITGLEKTIQFTLGPVASLYCVALNKQMGFYAGPSESREDENSDLSDFSNVFKNKFKESARIFFDTERLNKNTLFDQEEYMLLYPQTSIIHTSGARATVGLAGLPPIFLNEDQELDKIISIANKRPLKIYEELKAYIQKATNSSVASNCLKPIRTLIRSNEEVANSYEAGDVMRQYLSTLRSNIVDNIRRDLGI